MNDITKRATIRASGFYLTEHFPENFDDFSDEELHEFISDNVWEPLEHFEPKNVMHEIASLAKAFVEFK